MSIPQLFLQFVQENPRKSFVHIPSKVEDAWKWKPISRQESLEAVAGLTKRLQSLGVSKGTKVAIWANTRAEWCWIDLAVLSLGGVVVGIYPTLAKDMVLEQLENSETEILIVEREDWYLQWEEDFDELADLVHVLSIDEGNEVVPLCPAQIDLQWYAEQISALSSSDLATIVYTSGSTGKSKGVELHHSHFISNLKATKEVLPLPMQSRSIVCLPLAHSLQRFVIYRAFLEDMEGFFAPSLKDLPITLKHAQPTILIAVPRMLEKIQNAVYQQAGQKSSFALNVVRWALLVGWNTEKRKALGQKIDWRLKAQYRLADKLVLSTIREKLGTHLQCVVSGGAPLNDHTAQFFWALGMQVVEGWGLSETCAPATLNLDGIRKMGSVGKVLSNMELRISEYSEVLVRGEGVFQTYHQQDSHKYFEGEYFKTGDLGVIDDEGYLYITGRSKHIIVTAGGKNIAPRRIESLLDGELIHHSIVVGDAQPYLVALIALDPEYLESIALEEGWTGDFIQWSKQLKVQQIVAEKVAGANQSLAGFEQIKDFAILPKPLLESDALLTSTQKPRRDQILQHYQEVWRNLYQQ